MATDEEGYRIAVLGGTGAQGSGLALRWALAGYSVIIGSRSEERAIAMADQIAEHAPGVRAQGATNPSAASAADLVVMAVPYESHQATLNAIRDAVQDKIFVDVTVTVKQTQTGPSRALPERPAALVAQHFLGGGVQVTSAFHSVAAGHLHDLSKVPDSDVLVFGDNKGAREEIIRLAAAIGMRGWHGGPLEYSIVAEGLTSVLFHINRYYNFSGAGIRVTGPPRTGEAA